MNNNFDEIVTGLINLSESKRMNNVNLKKMMGARLYTLDFCTVRVDAGRGVGKTTYIKNHAGILDLVIVPSRRLMLNEFAEVMNDLDIVSSDYFDFRRIGGRDYRGIYIDEPSLVVENSADRIISRVEDIIDILVNPSIEQTFVLLGR